VVPLKFARRLLAELNSLQSARSSWAVDAHTWLLRAVELVDDGSVPWLHWLELFESAWMRQADEQGTSTQIFDGKLLLATVEREPMPHDAKSCTTHQPPVIGRMTLRPR